MNNAKRVAKDRGGECLSSKYVNNNDYLRWKCKCGNVWDACYHGVVNHGRWCPICSKKRAIDCIRYTLDDCISTAKERGGFCLSDEYFSNIDHLRWRCEFGHEWYASYSSILNGKTWCPHCNISSIGEKLVRKYFEIGFGCRFDKSRPKWLVSDIGTRLELDGFNEKLGIAFEFNGKQHSEEVSLFHRDRSFSVSVEYDRIKKKLCRKYNVFLIVIDYDVPFECVAKDICDKCSRLGLNINRDILDIDYRTLGIYIRDLDVERRIVESRGGILLSKKYISSKSKINVRCNNGHDFITTSCLLKRGCWCRYCKYKIDLEYVRHYVRSLGRCLSDEYINSFSKLKFCCSCGNEFLMDWNSVQQGSWCPKCAIKRVWETRRANGG